jgi:hypothetical protein
MAIPTLEDLKAQKRCTRVKNKPNAYDCMVDQPDGSVKKTRFFQAFIQKKGTPPGKNKKKGASTSKAG